MMSRVIVWLAALSLMSTKVHAEIVHGNGRLDHTLYHKHPPKFIVAGVISSITGKGYFDRAMTFDIHTVILGDRRWMRSRISVPTGAFQWPEDLVAYAPSSTCILILDHRFLEGYRFLHAVVPWVGGGIRMAADSQGAIRLLEAEIMKALKAATAPAQLTATLHQLAPILRPTNAHRVAPFTGAKDLWTRRAALAALVYATEKPEYIQLAAADIKTFFTIQSAKRDLNETKPLFAFGHGRRFLENYFFLENRSWKWGSRWTHEEAEKHVRIWKAILATGDIPEEAAALIDAPI